MEQGDPVLEEHLGSSWVSFQTHKPINMLPNPLNPYNPILYFSPQTCLKNSLLPNLTEVYFNSKYMKMLLKPKLLLWIPYSMGPLLHGRHSRTVQVVVTVNVSKNLLLFFTFFLHSVFLFRVQLQRFVQFLRRFQMRRRLKQKRHLGPLSKSSN